VIWLFALIFLWLVLIYRAIWNRHFAERWGPFW